MKAVLKDILRCSRCGGKYEVQTRELTCTECKRAILLDGGTPIFTEPPQGLVPSEKLPRGPHVGTPWRQENWRFLADQVSRLDPRAVLLDVGAGRGDFASLFGSFPYYLTLDVYPYPEVDIVCDLSTTNPFCPQSLDAVILMNVLEHIYSAHSLLATLADMLKPGGLLILAVPFMVKMHQEPVDYARYTQYALQRMGPDHGLEVAHLEGFYDPVSLLAEGTGNLRNAVLPEMKGYRRYAVRLLASCLQMSSSALGSVLGPGKTASPDSVRSHAPTGYEVVYRKSRAE